ncbi:MAG TPA: hypothetical protein VFC63_19340 [Blastocatellia bacterium]|nr:hypothetical protein [Blastocatellia bacterium]
MILPKEKADLLSQIKVEYNYAFQYINPKRIQNLDRMRLYSNQTRDKSLVGDTTVFTIFNTVHSKLYDDKLMARLEPGHPDDTYKIDFLNPTMRYDAYKMKKDQLDYDWDWYTLFWGSGWLDVSTWDSKKNLCLPSVIDNATFLPDPDGTLINGDLRGFGAFRFWGREIAYTKDAMKARGWENFNDLSGAQNYSSLEYQDKQFRRTAQNAAQAAQPNNYANELIPLLEWWTTVDNEKWLFTTDLQFQEIVRALKWDDAEWPLIQRKLFPIPGDPFGVSIPDLVEDKQRARSILINLGLMDAKAQLYPMYVYDRNAISPTSDLNFAFNKWIPSDGNPGEAVKPLDKQPIGQIVSYIMDTIDQAAQRATAATSVQQGVQSEKPRSANEVVRSFNQSDERISTSAKVFGWSEVEFWRWWLKQYNRYFTKAHSKLIKINGAFGPKFQKISGEYFKLEEDPDIYVESTIISDQENQEKKNDLTAFGNFIAQDQTANRRYLNKKAAQIIAGFDSDEVERIYPPTPDELKAEQENEQLNQNRLVKIDINDDHQAHLLIHANAEETKATIVHIEAHKKALMLQRQLQQANPQTPPNPGALPGTMAATPNLIGQGSAPASRVSPSVSVQK